MEINDDIAKEIIHRLKFSYDTYEEISKVYNVEPRAISRINKGISHKMVNEMYPIRNWRSVKDGASLTYEQVTDIIHCISSTSESLNHIAKRYNVDTHTIMSIKNGTTKMYRRNGLKYPLRKNN